MGTAKRERKKANRQHRLEELHKQQRRSKARRRGIQLAVVIHYLAEDIQLCDRVSDCDEIGIRLQFSGNRHQTAELRLDVLAIR